MIKLTHLMLSSVYFLVSQPSVQSIVLSYSPSYVCMKRNTIYRRLMESALFFSPCFNPFPKYIVILLFLHATLRWQLSKYTLVQEMLKKSTLYVQCTLYMLQLLKPKNIFNTLMQKMLRPLPRSVLKPVAARANSHRILLLALSSFFHSRYLPISSTSHF